MFSARIQSQYWDLVTVYSFHDEPRL